MSGQVATRPARADDAAALTALAHRSKAHWGYDASLLAAWRDDLTFTAESIAAQEVRVAERDGRIVGVIALSFAGDTAEVEHLWVDPEAMGAGLGRALFRDATELARARAVKRIVIDADPNAEGFYRSVGARPVGTTPSHPPGRELPRLVLGL